MEFLEAALVGALSFICLTGIVALGDKIWRQIKDDDDPDDQSRDT